MHDYHTAHVLADDRRIGDVHGRHNEVSAAAARLETCICDISGRMARSRLKVNPSQVEQLWFNAPRDFDKFPKVFIAIDSVVFKPSKLSRSADVTFDEELWLATQVSNSS